ncbi:MAG: S9 family peptidase [Bacteroidetes bacterium]|nr:S9 family peptidase [Bacteroidota bacterium]
MKRLFLSMFLLMIVVSSIGQNEKKLITLEDIFKGRKFGSRMAAGLHSMTDGDHYFQIIKDSLNVYEYSTGNLIRTILTSGTLIPAGDTAPVPIDNPVFSQDESRILFRKDEEQIYRYSSKANYYIYDTRTGKLTPLSKNGKQRVAEFSPDASKVAFVRENNIFLYDISTAKEKQITTDGKLNFVINGAPDWVYEEEFDNPKALIWSSDSKNFAFYRFDESNVKEYEFTNYGGLYPEHYKYKYPKGGETNSKISLFIYSLQSQHSRQIDIGKDTDIYIPRMRWMPDSKSVLVYRLNRHQNKLEFLKTDAVTGSSKVFLTEENKYYVEVNDDFHFLENNKGFLLTSEKDGFNHIYMYDMDGKQINQLTRGKWDVTGLKGVDEAKGLVYFMAAENSPVDRSLYVVSLDGKTKTRLTPKPGTYTIDFSHNYKWLVCNWSDINTPPVTTVNKANGELVRVLQDNAKLKPVLEQYNFSKVEFFSFHTSDNTELNGWMLKPPDFNPAKKYPVLFTIYGGPGSQTVINRWGTSSSWNQLFAAHGIIVVSVDNRGTGARGEEFKKCTYLQLGKFETLDQIEAAKYLGTLDYIDPHRIGMWGWSYGGFMTLSCMTKGADYFNLGVAVAPVTNWKYYDDIYTERFMRTPKENPEGYESNSPINHAEKLKGKLLIIHGMSDDNVHTQNTYDFITALVGAGKQFEMQLYPNSNHNIYTGKNTTFHNYERMTEFILKNL